MSINTEINRLLNFAKQNMLINEDDYYYAANRLLDVLKVDAFEPEFVDEKLPTAMPILENMLDYAAEKGLIENTTENRDLFDTRIMDCVMPRPSEVVRRFTNDYARSPKAATDEFYKMSIASNYIRKDRIDKNIVWKTATEYGDLDITINLSKPEKDPRDIAKAKLAPSSGYPKCLLCRENEGYAGHPGHPARETHRLIPLRLSAHRWFLQYSPYTYYNEHCIVLNRKHVPMKVSRKSFENLLDFVTIFPHYFLGSNADLPIVGGSILSHDHYQGGRYTFAMAKAPIEKFYTFPGFEDIKVGRVKWPMSTIRLQGEDREELADLAEKILDAWRKYSDPSVEILAETDGTPHNTITPIARRRGNLYELDLVLRNNRTTKEHPLGLFHPHAEVHHIKKENIGLIEVMGLAVLPARLKKEMARVGEELVKGTPDISGMTEIASHADWYKMLREKYPTVSEQDVTGILEAQPPKPAATPVEMTECIALAAPAAKAGATINEALAARRSWREFGSEKLSLEELSGVLWAAAGENRTDGKLTAPSALALYPITVYAVFEEGIYRYDGREQTLTRVAEGDHRAAAGRQPFVATAPLNLVYIADLQTYEGKGIPEENVLMLCAMDAAGYAENVNLYTAGHALRSITRGSAAADELLSLLRLDPARYRFILAQSVGK